MVGEMMLFSAHLQSVMSLQTFKDKEGLPLECNTMNHDAIDRHSMVVDARLRDLLCPGTIVSIFYDEVQQLFCQSPIFCGQTDFNSTTAAMTTRDCFYGLTEVMSSLSDSVHWRQTVCGSWFQIADAIESKSVSSMWSRVVEVNHVSWMTEEVMWMSFSRVLTLPSWGDVDPDTKYNLALLRGRPVYFFEHAWGYLWSTLCEHWNGSMMGSIVAMDLVKASIAPAVSYVRVRICKRLVRELWTTEQKVLSNGASTASLCVELYAAIKLNGGRVRFIDTGAAEDAAKLGILARRCKTAIECDPAPQAGAGTAQKVNKERKLARKRSKDLINLIDEPLMVEAFETQGDELVMSSESHATHDPVFQILEAGLAAGDIHGFRHTASVKGGALQVLFVWHVLRTVMIGCGSASLSQILRPLLDSRAKLPANLADFVVTAHCAVHHADLGSFPTKFHALLDPEYEGAVCYGMDYEAGTDVSFTARATAGGNLAWQANTS
jgi:hypothetical protein